MVLHFFFFFEAAGRLSIYILTLENEVDLQRLWLDKKSQALSD
jgi:hypothetical protein